MNSDDPNRVSRLLEEITQLFSEDYLRLSCDEPIQKAASAFDLPESPPANQAAFLEIMGSFVRCIYAQGWTPRQALNPGQAKAEAIRLLQRHYQGQNASDYEAAYLDALHPTFAGIEFILSQLTQVLVEKARKQYIRWVLHCRLNCLNWLLRRQLAAELIRLSQAVNSNCFLKADPSQMADHCADLLMTQRASESQITELISAGHGLRGL